VTPEVPANPAMLGSVKAFAGKGCPPAPTLQRPQLTAASAPLGARLSRHPQREPEEPLRCCIPQERLWGWTSIQDSFACPPFRGLRLSHAADSTQTPAPRPGSPRTQGPLPQPGGGKRPLQSRARGLQSPPGAGGRGEGDARAMSQPCSIPTGDAVTPQPQGRLPARPSLLPIAPSHPSAAGEGCARPGSPQGVGAPAPPGKQPQAHTQNLPELPHTPYLHCKGSRVF